MASHVNVLRDSPWAECSKSVRGGAMMDHRGVEAQRLCPLNCYGTMSGADVFGRGWKAILKQVCRFA